MGATRLPLFVYNKSHAENYVSPTQTTVLGLTQTAQTYTDFASRFALATIRDVCKLQAALLGADSAVVATDALSRRRRSRQAASLFAMQPIL